MPKALRKTFLRYGKALFCKAFLGEHLYPKGEKALSFPRFTKARTFLASSFSYERRRPKKRPIVTGIQWSSFTRRFTSLHNPSPPASLVTRPKAPSLALTGNSPCPLTWNALPNALRSKKTPRPLARVRCSSVSSCNPLCFTAKATAPP